MKHTITIIATAIIALSGITACAQNNNKNNQSNPEMNNKKVLVAYFSWSGNTKVMAEYIAEKTNADLFVIEREQPYSSDYEPCTEEAKAEKEANIHPAIKGQVKDFDQYDVVFVGAPCWWYTAPMPVFTFLEGYNFEGKTVIPFCTAYTAEYQTMNDIVKATPKSSHEKGLAVITTEMGGVGMAEKMGKVEQWLKELGF
ncbi:MAG: hypothetical protein IJP44_09490 [Bacteroidales bacterium]|nr:hypothetical protein [Bacteroidales bacterium]